MGMPLAFDQNRADFSGMSTEERLYISAVLHKAFVDVNEEGTEAAAATGVVIGVKSAMLPPEPAVFRADHPFLFLIVDNRTPEHPVPGQGRQPERLKRPARRIADSGVISIFHIPYCICHISDDRSPEACSSTRGVESGVLESGILGSGILESGIDGILLRRCCVDGDLRALMTGWPFDLAQAAELDEAGDGTGQGDLLERRVVGPAAPGQGLVQVLPSAETRTS